MAKKDNVKKLTIAELQKQDEKLNGQDEITVKIGDVDYKLTCDTVFRKTKQLELLDDLVDLFNEGRNRIELFDLATPYTALLVLKHFTSLDVPDDIDEALLLLRVLIDLEALDKLINILPVDEVNNVYELLTETVNNMKNNLEEFEAEAERLSEEVENLEVKEMLQDGNRG